MDWELRSLVPDGLRIGAIITGEGGVSIEATTTGDGAPCPECGCTSRSVHRHRERALSDLPCMGRPVRLLVRVRHFRCLSPLCPRKVFCERLGGVAAPRARRTDRQGRVLLAIAHESGGEAGARLARDSGMPISPDTLLRIIRRSASPDVSNPVALGVDDWALRKGRTYGTIMVDLHRHRPVGLLPDRSAGSFAEWLVAHPDVRIISRDRGGEYAEGGRLGAPRAVQVADRFHLLKNLGEVVERIMRRHADRLARVPAPGCQGMPWPRRDRAASRERTRSEMRDRYESIQELSRRGMSKSAIARALGVHRHTVQKYMALETAPQRRHRTRGRSILATHEAYILERWRQGCRNAMQLWGEVTARGYRGGYGSVARLVAHLRASENTGCRPSQPWPRLTPERSVGLLLAHERDKQEQASIDDLKALHPELCESAAALEGFARLVRSEEGEETERGLHRWMAAAGGSGAPELEAFVVKLRQDVGAVLAGLTLPYSQGQVEGQVNRLKLIKRQMFGRANFDLLRERFLNTGGASRRARDHPVPIFGSTESAPVGIS